MKISVERFLRKDHSFKFKKVRKVARLQGMIRDCIYQAMRIMLETDKDYIKLVEEMEEKNNGFIILCKYRLRKLR